MLLDISFLDDATRPPIPRLEGLTPAQRAAGDHLRMIHDHLRDNMKTLGSLLQRARHGQASAEEITAETADMAMIANYRRFGNLCGRHCAIVHQHHSIEDYHLFPVLAAQGPQFQAIAERLGAEHVVIHELLERLVAALGTLAADPSEPHFETARDLYQALERVLLSHLGWEEDAMGDALGYFGIM
ncbi:Hemerythrin HHE cation binding domain-containing protein [Devosia crocina]|uniref:Hemerythrin HHE cation binding domain-containing protein n=1 Tax=Devosia crocina TaxID=429728 RepID=A0A1I7NNR2_9HYPH|nr:hemerythrin domain-containing protein [Devosia crocina]SFV36190.1 Hemerythrin HHE cation binding domain-containing protein [Devosia crocina]